MKINCNSKYIKELNYDDCFTMGDRELYTMADGTALGIEKPFYLVLNLEDHSLHYCDGKTLVQLVKAEIIIT